MNFECSVDGCENDVEHKGLCHLHYLKLKKHGSPLKGGPILGELIKFIEDNKSYQGNECLIWPFGRGVYGYGRVNINGRDIGAHRVMCEKVNGAPPTPKHEAAHNCGKGHLGCVTPSHLRWATHQENMEDTAIHGTRYQGTSHHFAKLSEEKVKEIRSLYGYMPNRKIAMRFKVSPSLITLIMHGDVWSWVK